MQLEISDQCQSLAKIKDQTHTFQIITEESAGARARRAESEARRRSASIDIESTTGESKKTGDKKPNGGRALRLVEEEGEVTTGGESSGETERRIRPLSNTRYDHTDGLGPCQRKRREMIAMHNFSSSSTTHYIMH